MSVNLYRLFAIQDFGRRIEGVKGRVAVYVNDGNYPDPEILMDAQDLAEKRVNRYILFENKPWMYLNKEEKNWSPMNDARRQRLKYYERVLQRGLKLTEQFPDTQYAIFVNSSNKKDWHGEKMLYKLTVLDEVKSDTPAFSGTKPFKTITL